MIVYCVLIEPFGHGADLLIRVLRIEPFGDGADLIVYEYFV